MPRRDAVTLWAFSMPAAASVRRKKPGVQSRCEPPHRKLHDNIWAEKLLHMVLGATMIQVALSRFLIRESIIDGQRLIAFLDERGAQWSKIASDDALLPLVTLVTRIKGAEEPDFPIRCAQAKPGIARQRRRRSANPHGKPRSEATVRGRRRKRILPG